MTLSDYMPKNGRPPIVAAVNLATALATMKRGYSPANAAIAAVDYLTSQGVALPTGAVDTVRWVVEARQADAAR